MTIDFTVSDEVLHYLEWALNAVIIQIIAIFGTVANVINIICFVKQGLKDSISISLLGLAISDVGCLSTLIFSNLCLSPTFQHLDLPFEPREIQYLITAWPHLIFARVTGWITALITLERCLCIAMPLKVNAIFTSRRVRAVIVSFFVLITASVSPVYYVSRYDWKFSPKRNKTILGLAFAPDRESVEAVSFVIANIFIPYLSFMIIIVSTFVLALKLREKETWRQKSIKAGQAQALTNRDKKVAKMVVVISTMFIACFLPVCVLFVFMLQIPDLSVDGKHKNTAFTAVSIGLLLESINSSSNIFIYLHMSTKYREAFRQMFGLIKKDRPQEKLREHG